MQLLYYNTHCNTKCIFFRPLVSELPCPLEIPSKTNLKSWIQHIPIIVCVLYVDIVVICYLICLAMQRLGNNWSLCACCNNKILNAFEFLNGPRCTRSNLFWYFAILFTITTVIFLFLCSNEPVQNRYSGSTHHCNATYTIYLRPAPSRPPKPCMLIVYLLVYTYNVFGIIN